MTQLSLPPWRSLLYVPAHRENFIAKAAQRGADAIILDLEDGVPERHKVEARDSLKPSCQFLRQQGATVLVRVNRPWRQAWRDLEATHEAGVTTVLLPKVESSAHIQCVDEMLSELEGAADTPRTALIPLIESAKGLLAAAHICSASPRVAAVIPGNEDLAAEFGFKPLPETMLQLFTPLFVAARAAEVALLGLVGSGANVQDLDAYRARAAFSQSWGFRGATCIHPAQIPILNEVFKASEDETAWAKAVVNAFEAAGGEAVSFRGAMVDKPVYLRAQRILRALSNNS